MQYDPFSKSSLIFFVDVTDLSHFSYLKSGSVPLTSTMHVIVALSPICTVVFFGELFCKMGRDRGLAVEKMMEIFFKKEYFSCNKTKTASVAWCGDSAN